MKRRPVSADILRNLVAASREDLIAWRQLLAGFDYKPGWAFDILESDLRKYHQIVLHIKMLVWDTFEHRDLKPIVVTTKYTVPGFLHLSVIDNKERWTEEARRWLRRIIHEVEMHEADEWIRFEGEQTFNPHGDPQQLGRRPEGWEWLAPPEIAIAPTLKPRGSHGTQTPGDGRFS